MYKARRFLAVLIGIPLFAALSLADSKPGSDVDRLINLLVKKGVVTREEAAALRKEVASDAATEKVAATPEKREQNTQNNQRSETAAKPIKFRGWAQVRWTNAAGGTNPLELRRARLALEGSPTPRISYRLQVDAVRSPVLLDARVDFQHLRYARLTVGQFKIPFSQENLVSSRDLIPIERSLVVNNLVPGRDNGNNGRDIGLQLTGSLPRGDDRPLFDYAIGLFNGAGINRRDDNRRKDLATRAVLYPLDGLSLAANYYNGASGPQKLARERTGLELAYLGKLYSLRGEFIWGHDDKVRKRGWYGQFAYRFRPQWEGLFRVDSYEPDRRAPNNETNTYLLGLNWYYTKWVKLQLNYGLVDEAARPHPTHTVLTQLQFQY